MSVVVQAQGRGSYINWPARHRRPRARYTSDKRPPGSHTGRARGSEADIMQQWRTSSHSYSHGNCVEVGSWRKPSRSTHNGECVEIGQGEAVVGVRDTKDREA